MAGVVEHHSAKLIDMYFEESHIFRAKFLNDNFGGFQHPVSGGSVAAALGAQCTSDLPAGARQHLGPEFATR